MRSGFNQMKDRPSQPKVIIRPEKFHQLARFRFCNWGFYVLQQVLLPAKCSGLHVFRSRKGPKLYKFSDCWANH